MASALEMMTDLLETRGRQIIREELENELNRVLPPTMRKEIQTGLARIEHIFDHAINIDDKVEKRLAFMEAAVADLQKRL